MKTRSPPCVSDVAFQKWLKPTSYSVAAEAKLAIWPPTFVCLFARSTIAIAFQRTYDRMRCSISWSPGMPVGSRQSYRKRLSLLANRDRGDRGPEMQHGRRDKAQGREEQEARAVAVGQRTQYSKERRAHDHTRERDESGRARDRSGASRGRLPGQFGQLDTVPSDRGSAEECRPRQQWPGRPRRGRERHRHA